MPSVSFSAKTRPKTRGPCPSYGNQMTLDAPLSDRGPEKSTRYRLPKLKDDDARHEDDEYRVWSRHGYDYYSNRPGEEGEVSALTVTPRVAPVSHRAAGISKAYPKFQDAMISPVPQTSARLYAGNVSDPAFYRTLGRTRTAYSAESAHLPHVFDPSPSPVPNQHYLRTASPVKSAKSIHWTLSPFKNLQYDRKGRSRIQGPYSREFTVTCTAPHNWLKMRLGRSGTTMT